MNIGDCLDWLFGSPCADCGQRSKERKQICRSGGFIACLCQKCYERLPAVQEQKKEVQSQERKRREHEERSDALKLWIAKLNELQTSTSCNTRARGDGPLWTLRQVAALCVQLNLDGFKLQQCTAEQISWSTGRSGYRPFNSYCDIFYQEQGAYTVSGHSYGYDEGCYSFGAKVPDWLEQMPNET